MKAKIFALALVIAAGLGLSGCATEGYGPAYGYGYGPAYGYGYGYGAYPGYYYGTGYYYRPGYYYRRGYGWGRRHWYHGGLYHRGYARPAVRVHGARVGRGASVRGGVRR
jgi:hypothetical protein